MDVTIQTNKGKSFKMEIGFFDTVREIKEKVEKYHGVPVAKQSLYIHGAAMADERDTEYYEVLEGSKIKLFVEPDEGEKEENEDEEREEGEGERKRRRLNIVINVPATKRQVAVEMEGGETVGWLKEMILSEGLAAGRVALVVGGVEMQDQQRTLEEYGVGEGMEVSVVTRTAPAAVATAGGGKRMTVMVLPKGGTKKIAVEVNVMDNVREMRKELERLQSLQHLHLPPEGYFFIYKQEVMEEDHSFRWHGVRPNDTIEIFNGSVTGGS
ncbi:hypothetical protein J5N97_016714 [Dioscorea zingiberensis]|uniref:Ubiquitin-like domain-containing protein n=1 Tax=Dioscorea zingiberensis TaxID=325984 RepID=A0A9D5HFX1_9LILI|nr:hypothetical protein J5N97_016697 [Dioscorea zingiberensis]KAJ0974749.1 hypothetical protein J5N97_016714 [Dioscorea zingiberensis]